jgi:hypothetical protein
MHRHVSSSLPRVIIHFTSMENLNSRSYRMFAKSCKLKVLYTAAPDTSALAEACASPFSWPAIQYRTPREYTACSSSRPRLSRSSLSHCHTKSPHVVLLVFFRFHTPVFQVVPTSANIFDTCQRNASGSSANSSPLSQRGLRLMSRIRLGRL